MEVDLAQARSEELAKVLDLLAEAVLILDQQRLPLAAAYADMAQQIVARQQRVEGKAS